MAAQAPPAPAFAAFQGSPRDLRVIRRRRSVTLGASLGIHGLLLAAALAGAFSREAPVLQPVAPRVSVTLWRPSAPRAAPAPEAAPPPRTPRPRRAVPLVQPDLLRPAQPSNIEPAAGVEDPTLEAGTDAGDEGPASEGTAPAVAVAVAPVAPPPPALSAEQRRQQLERYLREVLRRAIDSRFVYPPQAERDGVEGIVRLRLTIDGGGKLLAVATVGACPADLLCDHAQRTTRAASPYPPPPRELGSTIQVDVPIAYRLN
jgi:protein TonB